MPKAIPSLCHMPDLSDLPSLVPFTLLHGAFPDIRVSRKAGLYRSKFTRLFSKAVEEYQLARECILLQMEEARRPAELLRRDGRSLYILGFTDHFETCINASHRLLRILDRLKSTPLVDPLPRQTRREIQALTRHLAGMRHAIEHMDEWIQRDEVVEGDPIVVMVSDQEDAAVVADIELPFADLAAALRKLYELGRILFPLRPPGYRDTIGESAT